MLYIAIGIVVVKVEQNSKHIFLFSFWEKTFLVNLSQNKTQIFENTVYFGPI